MGTTFLFQHENIEDISSILLISAANEEAALCMKLPIYKKKRGSLWTALQKDP